MINGGKSDFLKKIEKSIEKDGFHIYGFAITAEKEKLQRIASIKNIADMTITKA
jgi:nucleoside-triphosphatase THEP1